MGLTKVASPPEVGKEQLQTQYTHLQIGTTPKYIENPLCIYGFWSKFLSPAIGHSSHLENSLQGPLDRSPCVHNSWRLNSWRSNVQNCPVISPQIWTLNRRFQICSFHQHFRPCSPTQKKKLQKSGSTPNYPLGIWHHYGIDGPIFAITYPGGFTNRFFMSKYVEKPMGVFIPYVKVIVEVFRMVGFVSTQHRCQHYPWRVPRVPFLEICRVYPWISMLCCVKCLFVKCPTIRDLRKKLRLDCLAQGPRNQKPPQSSLGKSLCSLAAQFEKLGAVEEVRRPTNHALYGCLTWQWTISHV